MGGIKNGVLVGKNADFTQVNGPNAQSSESNGLIVNGQLWIGATTPNVGGTHVNVGTITSPDSSTTIGYSSPNITLTSGLGIGRYPITPYVVGPSGRAGYQTIQSAIEAANSAGGGTVFIQPGTYTENISLYDGVNLLAYPGDLGVVGLTTSSGMIPKVKIVGNTVINTAALSTNSNNTFTNILFSPLTGDVITFICNVNNESVISFDSCTINATQPTKAAFSCDGFPTINLLNCTITETTEDTCTLLKMPGSSAFTNISAKNTAFLTNSVTPCILQDLSDVHFTLSNCIYSSMIDISTSNTPFFSLYAANTVFTWSGNSNNPLVNVGAQEGNVTIDGSSCLSASGAFLTASVPAANNYSVITNTSFVDTVKLYGDAIDQYSGCTFNTGSNPAILMNSTGDVSFNSCSINSTANPAIGGTGSGTITLGGITFVNNASVAALLTKATTGGTYPAGNLGTAGYVWTSNGAGAVPTFQASGGGGGGISTLSGDTGSATGSTVTVTGTPTAGATVAFNAAVSTVEFNVTDLFGNTHIGQNAGNPAGLSSSGLNTSLGQDTLSAVTIGGGNCAFGAQTLSSLTTGQSNVAMGSGTMQFGSTAANNVAIGENALASLATGFENVVIGYNTASSYSGSESSNIMVGANITGNNAEIAVTRIGTSMSACYISGISGVTVTGAAVLCATDGQLGTVSSSERYKENIEDMDTSSSRIMNLRPVTFNYKNAKDNTKQYGLIAEEVEKLFPELVLYREGQCDSVMYHVLPSILLNEIQKLNKRIEALEAK